MKMIFQNPYHIPQQQHNIPIQMSGKKIILTNKIHPANLTTISKGRHGMDWIGVEWIGLERIGLEWKGMSTQGEVPPSLT
jgi:hypothetical protein